MFCILRVHENAVLKALHDLEKFWVVSTQIWVKYGQTQMLG